MLYSAFLIPVIVSIAGFFLFSKKVTWLEALLNVLGTSLVIVITFFICKSVTTDDTEYNTYLVKEARYYEEWETYVHQTCYRTVSCGKNCSYTVPYDCSYCNHHSAHYQLEDSGGNVFSIPSEEYNSYVKLWNHEPPKFVEMNRNITNYGRCGKDGDMYKVNWNDEINNSVSSTIPVSYENILQTNKSAFNYPSITPQNAKELGLYNYPEIDNYFQNSVLGTEKVSFKNKHLLERRINYMNGLYGKDYSCKVFVLLFKDQSINIAYAQEAYWSGGNRNEVVICVGIDKDANITWVKPFSWSKNKTMIPNIREDFFEAKNLDNVEGIAVGIENNVKKYFQWRDFERDFKYITYEPTTNQMILVYILSLIVSVGIMWYSVVNEIDPEY